MRRLEEALNAASRTTQLLPKDTNAGDGHIESEDVPDEDPDETAGIGADEEPAPEITLPPYMVADFDNWHKEEPHEVPIGKMALFVQKIIDIEGPVHEDEVARRVASLFDKQRTGGRISDHTIAALRHLRHRDINYRCEDGFWFTSDQQANPPLRDRSQSPLTLRKADMIPPLEIAAAIKQVLAENGAIAETEIPRAVALLFGFLRTGPEFKPAVEPVVEKLLEAWGNC